MAKELELGLALVQLEDYPEDIMEQLDELYEEADEEDKENFIWLYEAASLRVNELTEEEIEDED